MEFIDVFASNYMIYACLYVPVRVSNEHTLNYIHITKLCFMMKLLLL